MKPSDLVLHCYAERKNNQWQAFCLDLTLASQSDTPEEAIAKLRAQIVDYVDEALTGEDVEHFDDLILRRAPLRYWMKYYCYQALVKLHQARSVVKLHQARSELFRLFALPIPLTTKRC